MICSRTIKEAAGEFGADLCGIAPADRFCDAPKGFHPADIFPGVKSVIVFALHLPGSVFRSVSPVPYTWMSDAVLSEVFRITLELCKFFEENGAAAVPVPSEPYEYWEEEKKEGRGILSLKHAGVLAGLGVMGRNTLLYNRKYGNMMTLGAVMADREFEPDPVREIELSCTECNVCEQNCPGNAISSAGVEQKRCRKYSNSVTKKGYALYQCCNCRKLCPCSAGVT